MLNTKRLEKNSSYRIVKNTMLSVATGSLIPVMGWNQFKEIMNKN